LTEVDLAHVEVEVGGAADGTHLCHRYYNIIRRYIDVDRTDRQCRQDVAFLSDERYMRLAIDKAREGVRNGELPFGACVVRNGKVVGCAHNTILSCNDLTAHAEMNAIHEACQELGTLDLSGCTIYCTCEPCPMCLGALGLANIEKVVYGARIGDVTMPGFVVLETPGELFKLIGNGKLAVYGDFLREENVRLFREWEERQDKK
jgi:guanine deaminase